MVAAVQIFWRPLSAWIKALRPLWLNHCYGYRAGKEASNSQRNMHLICKVRAVSCKLMSVLCEASDVAVRKTLVRTGDTSDACVA